MISTKLLCFAFCLTVYSKKKKVTKIVYEFIDLVQTNRINFLACNAQLKIKNIKHNENKNKFIKHLKNYTSL